jgi:hypothetical protein
VRAPRALLCLLVIAPLAAGGRAMADGATPTPAAAAAGSGGEQLPIMDSIPGEPNLRGSLRTVADAEFLRYSGSAISRSGTDLGVDLMQYASLTATGLLDPRISAVFSGRYEANVVRPPAASELSDLSDAEPARRHWKIFDAYAQAADLADGHVLVRAGRQAIDGFEPVSLDGGRVDVNGLSIFRARAYGGYRASVYSGTDDKPVFGGDVGARLPGGLDLVAGWFHYVVDLYGLEAREDVCRDLDFTGRLEAIDGKVSELEVRGRGRLAPAGLELRLGYIRWYATDRFPYDYTFETGVKNGITRLLVSPRTDGNEASAEIVFDLLPHVILSVAGRIFRPIGAQDDPYNLPYEEVSPAVEIYDLPFRGSEFDLRYTGYRAKTGIPAGIDPTTVQGFIDLRGEGVSSYDEVGVDVGQRVGGVRAEAGFVLRREDYVNRFGTITGALAWDAHLEARWLASARWTFVLRYDFARDFDLVAPDVGWDQRVRIEVRYAF